VLLVLTTLGTVPNVNVTELDQKMVVSVQMLPSKKKKKKKNVVVNVTLKSVPNVPSVQKTVSNVPNPVQKETHHQNVQSFQMVLNQSKSLTYQSVLLKPSIVVVNV